MKIAILSFYSGMNNRGVERWVKELSSRMSEKYEIAVYQNRLLSAKVPYRVVAANINYYEKTDHDRNVISVSGRQRTHPESDSGPSFAQCYGRARQARMTEGRHPCCNQLINKLSKRFFLDYKSLKVLQFTLKIFKDLLRGNYDIVIPTDGGWEPAIVRIISWLKRKKMVIIGHAGIGFDDANNIWCLPDVFVSLSSHAQNWAKRVNPFIKTVHIPDAVDIGKFTPNGKKVDLGFKNDYPIALCVGALEAGKRIELIINTISKFSNLNLLVCGKGELEEKLLVIGNKLLGNRFKMEAYEFEEMPEVYRSCNLLVSASLPSYSFEMVLLEAMSCGLPVVANNDPIRREIVGVAGILVDASDSDKITEGVKKVLSTKWKNQPRKQAEKFDWEVVYKKYDTLFNNLII